MNHQVYKILISLSLSAFLSTSWADLLKPGSYRDSEKRHELIIRDVLDGNLKKKYAVIFWSGLTDRGGSLTSIYEVAQAQHSIDVYEFYPITQTADHQLEADKTEALYRFRLHEEKGKVKFQLDWTNLTRRFGSNIPCTLAPEFTFHSEESKWGDFSAIEPGAFVDFNGRRNRTRNLSVLEGDDSRPRRPLELSVTRSITDENEYFLKTSNFWIETPYSESFVNKSRMVRQEPLAYFLPNKAVGATDSLPGIMTVREKVADAVLDIDGNLSSEISYLLIPILDSKDRLRRVNVLKIAPGVQECGYVSIGVRN